MIIGMIGGGLAGLPKGMRYPTLAQGKDEVANYLAKEGFQRVAFADNLKREVAAAFGTTLERLENRDLKEVPQDYLALIHCSDDAFVTCALEALGARDLSELDKPRSPRTITQLWGTDYRRGQNPNYWVEQGLAQVSGEGDFIVTDVRMMNEAEGLDSMGAMMLRIVRPGTEVPYLGTEHPSETDLLGYPADGVIINHEGDFDGLFQQVEEQIGAYLPE